MRSCLSPAGCPLANSFSSSGLRELVAAGMVIHCFNTPACCDLWIKQAPFLRQAVWRQGL